MTQLAWRAQLAWGFRAGGGVRSCARKTNSHAVESTASSTSHIGVLRFCCATRSLAHATGGLAAWHPSRLCHKHCSSPLSSSTQYGTACTMSGNTAALHSWGAGRGSSWATDGNSG